jgi:hypothetical protein
MIFTVVIFFLFAAMLAATSNPDIFSPAKLFLFFFLSFHVGALFTEITVLTSVLILLVLAVGIWAIVLEAGRVRRSATYSRPARADEHEQKRDYALFLWAISVPPLLVQFYMIQHFGGMEGYIRSLGFRVVEWAGFGWARVMIALFVPINLVYFALGLHQRRKALWWAFYAGHFLILLGMAALSGSRSSLLNIFLIQFILYHYVRAAVKPGHASLLATGLMLAAMVLGVYRNRVRYDETGFSAAYSGSGNTLSFASFNYGVEPLEVIATSSFMPLAHGSTFFSLITNAIPRNFWPDKPESGGVFFTKNYLGDAWMGYSNLTPTFLGEWLINFGWIAGIIGFFISYSAIFLFCGKYYFSILERLKHKPSDRTAIDVVIYVHVILAVIGLMVGETTNVVLTLVVSQLIPLWAIRYYVKRVSR